MFDEKQVRAKNTLPELSKQRHSPMPVVSAQLQRQVLAGQHLAVQTLRPVALQRQQASPVLQALQLQREAEGGLEVQRQVLQRQVDQAPLPAGAIETALQRQAARQAPVAPLMQTPSSPAEWAQAAKLEVQRVQDPSAPEQTRWLSGPERERHLGSLRSVGHGLAQGFKDDRGPAVQRYAEYGESLATLQRRPLTGAVPRMVLTQVSPTERPLLQRAMDEALQRQEDQEAQEQAALHQHALQRQLAELDHQAERPILERIQARRGSGSPLPLSVQQQLEAGLNHDLSGVRVHTDAEADLLSKKVNAVAFTTGQDIYFQFGKFDPNSKTGIELLAHEATHTVQQSRGQVGRGIDPDAGLEQEARSTGAQIARAVQLPGRSSARPAPRHRTGVGATFTPTTTVQRLGGASPTAVPPVLTVGKLGIVKQADGANLHASPDPKSALVVSQPIALGTRVGVISQTADGWSRISLPSGQSGYIQTARVTTDLPDPAASLIRVNGGQTAIGLAEQYYKGLVKPGQDLRFYVNVLEYVDRQRGTGAFQGGQTLKAGSVLWVPGSQMAQSLVGQVGSGSITGGRWAEAKEAVGNGPGANILRSVLESPQYIGEVLGETWKAVKEHWPVLLATTIALVGAELLVGALAAMPEPTTITKFLAVGLQGLITVFIGATGIVAGAAALKAGHQWLTSAWTAKGEAGKLKAASKAFLNMIGDLMLVVASAAGVRASGGETLGLMGLYTRENLIAQIGNKATYETLMNLLRERGLVKNNAQVLGELLKKVPDPLELKGWLRKVDKPVEFLVTLDKYPLNQVRTALSEIDGRSVPPDVASKLLRLNLEHPVPTEPITPARQAYLTDKFGKDVAEKTYQHRSPMLREELTPAQLAKDKAAGEQYQQLLNELLDHTEYVYRYTSEKGLEKLRDNGWDIRDAFMTNVMTENPNAASFGAQIKPVWYKETLGNPNVVLKIPRRLLTSAKVPRPTGNTDVLAGWEFTTTAYPEAGRGGLLQFMGSVSNKALEDGIKSGEIEVRPLSGAMDRLRLKDNPTGGTP